MRRMVLWALVFVALTVGGAVLAISRSDLSPADLAVLGNLGLPTIALLASLAIGLYITDVIRYRAFGRCVGEPVSWRAGLDASVANFFFSWLTPGAAMGAPATIYMLGRRGISWHGATLIAFGKSLTGIALVLMVAGALLFVDLGPRFDAAILVVLLPGVFVVTALLALIIIASKRPAGAKARVTAAADWLASTRLLGGPRGKRLVAAVSGATSRAIEKLADVMKSSWQVVALLLFTHLIYFACLSGIGVVLAIAFGASSVPLALGISTVFVAFSYVAPTPGGAGLAEATATLFYGRILSPADAVVVVLLFRSLTFYLHIAFGLVYLLAVGGVSGLREIARAREPSD